MKCTISKISLGIIGLRRIGVFLCGQSDEDCMGEQNTNVNLHQSVSGVGTILCQTIQNGPHTRSSDKSPAPVF